ncbi:hypothetical protein, partial [Rhizobium leguminosarum]|uniref:hypothetical protein n=1 Tax=Rhizobium leguminosarum TaxID=384 RepID=UPI001C974AA7
MLSAPVVIDGLGQHRSSGPQDDVPYPPGSPILVPGQVIDIPSLKYLDGLDVREIHGFDRERGLW